ncbi:MAG: flagellar M-ring protein FliF [Clostridiaceae bacterium]|nr:flagellar M-ring protein FliF [Clostridiaceae bacterium]
MTETLNNIWEKIKKFWSELDKSQKTRIYLTAGILVFAIAITCFLTLRVEYVPLFEKSEDVDLQPVVNYLTENNIKFKKGEKQIYVDSRKKPDIEFDLTTQGIVSPEVTFADTWSKLSLTATEKDKENLWKHYLTNDLVYKLKKFENVENATVQYSKPEKTYWVRPGEDQEGSAYVMLKTKKPLRPEQVDAAALVVASSLGIPADRITIVDENLNPLFRQGDLPDLARANTQEEMRRQREMELEKKVYDFFKIGIAENDYFDTISVSANAVLDFDTLVSSSVKYTAPDEGGQGFIKSQETLHETIESGAEGQVPGTDTNPQTAPTYQFDDDNDSTYEKNHNVEERIFNEITEQSEKAVGKLVPEQSTMSISLWYGDRVKSDEGFTPEYIEEVKNTAYAATGIPVENISVSVQKLAVKEPVAETLADTVGQLFDRYGFYVLMLILLIVMTIVAIPRKETEPEDLKIAALETAVAGADVSESPEEIVDINVEEPSELKKQIDKFAQENPDAVAQLLRNWIADDWD